MTSVRYAHFTTDQLFRLKISQAFIAGSHSQIIDLIAGHLQLHKNLKANPPTEELSAVIAQIEESLSAVALEDRQFIQNLKQTSSDEEIEMVFTQKIASDREKERNWRKIK